tara:strand:+ start:122222 stop:122827 length:606 start_codon:yes stop_codon:yes gene_type:complete
MFEKFSNQDLFDFLYKTQEENQVFNILSELPLEDIVLGEKLDLENLSDSEYLKDTRNYLETLIFKTTIDSKLEVKIEVSKGSFDIFLLLDNELISFKCYNSNISESADHVAKTLKRSAKKFDCYIYNFNINFHNDYRKYSFFVHENALSRFSIYYNMTKNEFHLSYFLNDDYYNMKVNSLEKLLEVFEYNIMTPLKLEFDI